LTVFGNASTNIILSPNSGASTTSVQVSLYIQINAVDPQVANLTISSTGVYPNSGNNSKSYEINIVCVGNGVPTSLV
jgi:hypothetical protein